MHEPPIFETDRLINYPILLRLNCFVPVTLPRRPTTQSMLNQGLRSDWSIVEGPSSQLGNGQAEEEWMFVQEECTAPVPNMSWADIVKIPRDDAASAVQQPEQPWTQVSHPIETAPTRSKQPVPGSYPCDEDDYDCDRREYVARRRQGIYKDAARKRMSGRQRNSRCSGHWADRKFGRQYDTKQDREVQLEIRRGPCW